MTLDAIADPRANARAARLLFGADWVETAAQGAPVLLGDARALASELREMSYALRRGDCEPTPEQDVRLARFHAASAAERGCIYGSWSGLARGRGLPRDERCHVCRRAATGTAHRSDVYRGAWRELVVCPRCGIVADGEPGAPVLRWSVEPSRRAIVVSVADVEPGAALELALEYDGAPGSVGRRGTATGGTVSIVLDRPARRSIDWITLVCVRRGAVGTQRRPVTAGDAVA